MGPALRGEGVENGRLSPVAVEAQVGHGQVGLGRGLRGEAHEAVEEGAVGRVLRDGGVEVSAGLDVHADRGLAVRGNGDGRALISAAHGRAGVGDVHALASPIGGLAGEEPTLNDLGEGLRAQLVGGLGTGQVMQRDVEVPALRTIPQVRLGTGALRGADHGRVHGRGRGRQDVRQTRALLARGVRGTGVLERVDDGSRRAHDEVLDDVHLLACAHGRKQRIVLNALQDEGADARHLRGCHRGAGLELVGAAGHGRVDVATGGANLGLEAQVRGDAPRREGRHGVFRARGHDLAGGDAQVVVGGGQHGLAVSLRDEGGGHAVCRQAHHDKRVTGHVVVEDEACGLRVCNVVELGLEGEGTSLDQHDLSGEALGVLGLERGAILGRADAAIDVLEGTTGQVRQVGHLLAVSATGALVGDVAVADGEGAVRQRVVDRGDRDHGRVGRWLTLGGGVGVGREGQVLAGGVAVPGRVVVAGCRIHGDADVLQTLEDGRVDRVSLIVHASELAKRQVHDIGVQDDHVVKGGEKCGIRDVTLDAARDLGDDDLRVGGDAHDFASVARGDAGDVRAVRSSLAGRRGIRVVIRVVVCEGELFRHVGASLAVTQMGGQGLNLVLGKPGGPVQGTRERGVGHVHTRVDDGDDLAITLLGDLVSVHHQLRAEVGGVLGGGARGVRRALSGDLVVDAIDVGVAIEEGSLDAAHRADRVEGSGGGAQREALQGLVVLALHLGGGAGERGGHGLVDRGEGGRTVCAIVELDDDRDEGGRVDLVGRRCRSVLGGLPALRGERGIDVTDGQGRGRGARVGSGVRRGWRGCESRGPCQGERAGAGEREERRWFLRCHVRTPMCRRATVLAGGGNSVVPATTVKIPQRTHVTNFVSQRETHDGYFTQ